MNSPVGELTLVATDQSVTAILWENDAPGRVRVTPDAEDVDHRLLCEVERQLIAYFGGTLAGFSVPLELIGTDFQKAVWNALLTIPSGETGTYGQIARQIGKPAAVRAVGAAIGRNPISIVVPCHRVIGSNGALTGFAGGLPAKEFLLTLERGDGIRVRGRGEREQASLERPQLRFDPALARSASIPSVR